MEVITDFYSFLIFVVFISLSGVMTPGPLLAVTIAKGFEHKIAGVLVSFGHGMVEFPLMFIIYFGFTQLLASSIAQKSVGLVGGLVLIYMGFRMVRAEKKTNKEHEGSKHGPFIAGILATGANPYFLLWWATIGADLVTKASGFGFMGFLIFAVTHWSCDLIWNTIVSVTVFKSRRFWTKKTHQIVFGFCFIVLICFGALFIISALL